MCRVLRFLLNRKPFPRYAVRANGLGKTITNALPLWVIFILSPFYCGADIYLEGITPDFVNLLMLTVCPVFWIVTAPTFRCHRLDGLFLVLSSGRGYACPAEAHSTDGRRSGWPPISCCMPMYATAWNASRSSFACFAQAYYRGYGAYCRPKPYCPPAIIFSA